MATNLRSALEAMTPEPISGDAVLLALGFLGQRSEMTVVAAILGEDSASPVTLQRMSSAVYLLEKQDFVRRDVVNPRKIELTDRGRRQELVLREQLIRRSSRATLAAAA